mgnify:FL=1
MTTTSIDLSNNNFFTYFDFIENNNMFLETNSIFSNKIGEKNIDINVDETVFKSINFEPPYITRQNAFNKH